MNVFIIAFSLTFLLSLLCTFLTKSLAKKLEIVDKPNQERKIHMKATPLLGGLAIFVSFFLVLFFYRDQILVGDLDQVHWLGFFLASLVLIIGGAFDDKYNLKARYQLIFPFIAILIVVLAGVSIEKITNPIGSGFIYLDLFKFELFDGYLEFSLLSSLLIAFWLLGMMYTTKLLDGLDGLVSGVTMIGSLIIFLFTITEKYYQIDIAFASFVLAAACLGFLFFNWHPASVFLGEGGSLFLGFALGVLAIISGGKIAIALLVMALPVFDLVWTIIRRLLKGKNPLKFSDREHLHFKLHDLGIGQRKTVLIYYIFASLFGLSALFLQSKGKLIALSLLLIIMILMVYLLNKNIFKNKIK